MKLNMNKIFGIAVSVAVLSLAGCTTEKQKMEEHHFDNRLYINTSAASEEILVKAGGSLNIERQLTVGTALQVDNEVTGRFVADASLLGEYKAAFYDEEAVLFPAEKCELENAEFTIDPGTVVSSPVTVHFNGLETLDRETVYVMPVAIRDVKGIEVLDSKTAVYYVFKGAALINVVANLNENKAWPDFNNDAKFNNLSTFTFEAYVRPNSFNHMISTLMGIEGGFLLRFGDAGVPADQLQVACSSNFTNSDMKIETGKWSHVAVTFDNGLITVYINGSNKGSKQIGTRSYSFGTYHNNEDGGQPRCFWIGYSYNDDRFFDGDIAEARIWNIALTEEQINEPNHFFVVDPASDGLISYWKFDEGTGNVIKDYSSSGYNLTCQKNPTWNKVSLPEKQ